jgi:hypothetical protein
VLQRCASKHLCFNNTQKRVEKSLTALEVSTVPENRGAFFAGLPSSERALSEGRNPKAAPVAMGSSSKASNCTQAVKVESLLKNLPNTLLNKLFVHVSFPDQSRRLQKETKGKCRKAARPLFNTTRVFQWLLLPDSTNCKYETRTSNLEGQMATLLHGRRMHCFSQLGMADRTRCSVSETKTRLRNQVGLCFAGTLFLGLPCSVHSSALCFE